MATTLLPAPAAAGYRLPASARATKPKSDAAGSVPGGTPAATPPEFHPGTAADVPPGQDLGPQIVGLFSQFQDLRRCDAALRGRPIPDVPADLEEPVLDAFCHWHALRQQRRLQRAELIAMRTTLGLLLRRHRATFARGEFKPWLRAQRIPVSTAYALIYAVLNQRPGTPRISVRGTKLRLRLKPRAFATARHALEKLLDSGQPFDLADCIFRRLERNAKRLEHAARRAAVHGRRRKHGRRRPAAATQPTGAHHLPNPPPPA